MMKQSLKMATIFTVLVAVGCDKPIETQERVPLELNGGIQTKASGTSWTEGDSIGIYMVRTGSSDILESAENRRYVTADGDASFSCLEDQTIYFPIDGMRVDFLAYYPYKAQLSTGGMILLDVSDQSNLPAIDLMTAKTLSSDDAPLDKDHPAVSLSFSHRLTKLTLNVEPGTGLTRSDLAGLSVEITNQRTEGLFNPMTAIFEEISEVDTISLNINSDGTKAEALLLPCAASMDDVNPIITDREMLFTLSSGEVLRWEIPNEKEFLGGEANLYTITIHRSRVTVSASITDWNYGNGENGEVGDAD